jgi:hypothetical protein
MVAREDTMSWFIARTTVGLSLGGGPHSVRSHNRTEIKGRRPLHMPSKIDLRSAVVVLN